MNNNEQRFSVDDICTLTDLPRRRLRFYIQQGVVSAPEGAKRGAYYTRHHLEQIISIKKWQKSGLSLERIRELLHDDENAPPLKPRGRGSVEVWSHLIIDDGIELHIDPSRAGLRPDQIRDLTRRITQEYEEVCNSNHNEEEHDDV